MQTLAANEAKTNFGQLLIQAQQAPVQISKNGKPVAVIMSTETFESIENLKLQILKNRVEQAKMQIEQGQIVDGASVFEKLLSQTYTNDK